MMDLDAAQQALFASGAVGICHLIELDIGNNTLRFTTFNADLVVGGNSYLFGGELIDVSPIKQSTDSDTQAIELSLTIANSALLAKISGNVEDYRGHEARVYLQPFDSQFRLVGPPRQYFFGEMDPVSIKRDDPGMQGGSAGGTAVLPVMRTGLSRSRNQDPLRLTDAQQKSDFPGDRGFEGLRKLLENPVLWISKRFQEYQ
ncbi:DUF2163 domain-containing protein [Roseateles sp.]|uniref:baseplate hub domain-containing protein n=1 Tax=Roseateles sp. TaxID=1971397 RepID=UPI002F4250B8